MITLKLIGWQRGLQTVSLISAICEHSGISLPQAKAKVEDLLAGQVVTIEFSEMEKMKAFRQEATGMGAKCE